IAPVRDGRIQSDASMRYDLTVDPNELQPTATLPDAFTGIEAAYQGVIQPVIARSQGPEPAKRTPDHSEHERLRALGYVDDPSSGERGPK
ncbi:MAG: hypothetical protein VX127_11310, partial [Myxococcota bacterium]|nr:hypothetical protein [Myxococcota bacterium]